MTEQEVIQNICKKENTSILYDIRIGELPVYMLIRGFVRYKIIENYGLPVMNMRLPVKRLVAIKSILVSFYHLLKLWVSNRKYPSVYYSFARIDKIGKCYLDKFTDPIIDQCEKKGNYIILDYGRAGMHLKPRVHNDSVVYLDLLSVLSRIYSVLFCRFFLYKHRKEFSLLFRELNEIFEIEFNKSKIIKEIGFAVMYTDLLQRVFKKVSAERVIGPARAFMAPPFIAAKRQGMKTYELQHGISYGETVLYSGYRDEMILPDYFLAFGDNKPIDVYGIDESRIVNIGWALQDYIVSLPYDDTLYGKKDVLVVSDPEITIPILKAIIVLAKENPEYRFYFRPHPHEEITQKHKDMIAPFPNIKLQNNSVNITVVLNKFNLILGENSTVIYEALAIRKKVGRLFFDGLNPLYKDADDRDCFWEIRNQTDFLNFVEGDVNEKGNKCIYSPFDKKKFLFITGISE